MWHPTEGRAQVLDYNGCVVAQTPWRDNMLADEGEARLLDVFFREQPNPQKWLGCLIGTPHKADTMNTVDELEGAGYGRARILSMDWDVPVRSGPDMQISAAQVVIGPAEEDWAPITHVFLTTTEVGNAGFFLLYIPLTGAIRVLEDQSFRYVMRLKAR